MRKEELIYVILGILIVLTLLSFAYFLSVQEPLLGPTLDAFNPPLPENCSNQENITSLWDYVFKNKPSSEGLTILTPTIGCDSYGAVNITNENNFYILYSSPNTTLPEGETYLVWAIHGKATPQYTLALETTTQEDLLLTINLLFDELSYTRLAKRDINTLENADTNFTDIFNMVTPTTTEWITLYSEKETTYSFNDTSTSILEANTTTGIVSANYSIEYFTYFKTKIASCTSNYTAINATCKEDDTIITWYNDTNSCPNTSPPENITIDCDFNNNRIIGNQSNIDNNNLEVEIHSSSNPLNFSETKNGTELIEIKEGNIVRIEFNKNFDDNPLNLKNIKIEKQSSNTDFGYLIVEGITETKT